MSTLDDLITSAAIRLKRLFRRALERERSMENIDANATGMASVAQSDSDAAARAAGAPAELGGQG